jgi:hypothetical protein
MDRFVIRAVDNEVELGAYSTLEEARLWAKRLAFANTCDVEIHDATGTLVETRRNETEIKLDAEQTAKWRANDASLRDHFQRQADQFECAIILVADDGEHLDRLPPK